MSRCYTCGAPGTFHCDYCGRTLVGKRESDDDGWVFVHDDVPHPPELVFDDDEENVTHQ